MSNQLSIIAKDNNLTLLEDNSQWTNRFEIKSETSNRLYIVAKNKSTGVWGCSCPGWIVHRKCKHLNSIDDMIICIEKLGINEVKELFHVKR